MQSFYDSRNLSKKLNIPLARFKRWAREFLPPDNLGGYQSGYARQYNVNDAFKVYLGGFMVHDAKLSVAQAKGLLEKLSIHLPNLYSNLADTSITELQLLLVLDKQANLLVKMQNGTAQLFEDEAFTENVSDLIRVVLVGKILLRFVASLNQE